MIALFYASCFAGCDTRSGKSSYAPAYYPAKRTVVFPEKNIPLRAGGFTKFGTLSSREWEDPIVKPAKWNDIGDARGSTLIEEGQMLKLRVGNLVPTLEALQNLEPNDIQVLNIGNMNYDPNDLKYFAHLKGLRVLYTDGNELTDQSLHYLSGLQSLEFIDFQGCPISDKGLIHLETLTNLRKIWLFRTNVTKHGIGILRKKLPYCEVEWETNKP